MIDKLWLGPDGRLRGSIGSGLISSRSPADVQVR